LASIFLPFAATLTPRPGDNEAEGAAEIPLAGVEIRRYCKRMDGLAAFQANQRQTDAEHLKLLSVFHFVGAGLAGVSLLLLYGHYSLFSQMLSGPMPGQQPGGPPFPLDMFVWMRWIYVAWALMSVGMGLVNLASGLFMKTRSYRVFSIVVAALNCFYVPLGTTLGIFTIIVLVRDSVRETYAVNAGG
jgi:hypothetical protein